ncbi:hypothetical protein ABPG74_014365 [Tetrahymena malaccensis]
MSLLQGVIKKKLAMSKENIVFSSEDSFNTDNSFNSSVENDNTDDYKNTFFHLKEQMNQLFIANPELQDNLTFESFDPEQYENDQRDEEEKKKQKLDLHQNPIQKIPKPNYVTEQTKLEELKKLKDKEQKQKSKLWSSLSKNIVRNGHYSTKIPTLETVNHRLNVYKHEIERVDYIDILTKENTPSITKNPMSRRSSDMNISEPTQQQLTTTNQIQAQSQASNANKKENKSVESSEEEEEQLNPNGEIEYYSFKKKMQMKAKELREKQEMLKEKKRQKKRNAVTTRGFAAITQLQEQLENNPNTDRKLLFAQLRSSSQMLNPALFSNTPTLGEKRSSVSPQKQKTNQSSSSSQLPNSNVSPQPRKSVFNRLVNQGGQIKSSNSGDFTIDANKLEQHESGDQFHSKIGKALYLAMQQSKGDKESFRKLAQNTLRDYNKSKANLFKAKKFPPSLPKFTQEDNIHLNYLLPDFNNPLFVANKSDPFEEIKDFQPAPNSSESEFLAVIDKIQKGKLLNLWKQQQAF